MPRAARKKSSTGIYHAMQRGINGNADGQCLEFAESGKRMTDKELAAEIEETFGMTAAMIRNEPKESRNRILESILKMEGVSTRQLSRVSGVSTGIIWALSSG